LTQDQFIKFIGDLVLSDGLSGQIRNDSSDQTITTIASQLNIALSPKEIEFIRDHIDEIDDFCVAIQPIDFDRRPGKSARMIVIVVGNKGYLTMLNCAVVLKPYLIDKMCT
jgi:hypothetical protein